MKKVEFGIKAVTVLCFFGAVVYAVINGDFMVAGKCALGALFAFLPDIIYTLSKKRISSVICVLFYLFLLGAIFATEIFGFYSLIPHWDTLLHGFSGAVLTAFGFALVDLLNKPGTGRNLNPFFVALFAFSFALGIGALWEIYEYSFDCILGMNMQRFLASDGVVLSGQAALYDTMKDIIVDCIAALVTAFIGGTVLKVKGKNVNDHVVDSSLNKNKETTVQI